MFRSDDKTTILFIIRGLIPKWDNYNIIRLFFIASQ